MNYRKFSFVILTCSLVFVLLLVLTNVIIDPFYVFRTPFFKVQYQVNDRYAKVAFLERHKGEFNGLIMGSSRMFFTEPAFIERYVPGSKFYNFSTIAATTYEHMIHLKYFLDNGYPIKHVYIGLDAEVALNLKSHNDGDSLVKLHPDISKKNPIEFYWSFLTIFPETDIKRKLTMNFAGGNPREYAIEVDGALHSKKPVEGSKELPQHLFALPDKMRTADTNKSPAMEDNLKALSDIVDMCKKHNVTLTIFISPFHTSMVKALITNNYLIFLKRLASMTPYWDFSGYNSITADSRNYMDASHYTPKIAKFIAARIFGDKTVPVPGDFGVLVTEKTIHRHVEDLREQVERSSALRKKAAP